jgi:hypothetical protein
MRTGARLTLFCRTEAEASFLPTAVLTRRVLPARCGNWLQAGRILFPGRSFCAGRLEAAKKELPLLKLLFDDCVLTVYSMRRSPPVCLALVIFGVYPASGACRRIAGVVCAAAFVQCRAAPGASKAPLSQ